MGRILTYYTLFMHGLLDWVGDLANPAFALKSCRDEIFNIGPQFDHRKDAIARKEEYAQKEGSELKKTAAGKLVRGDISTKEEITRRQKARRSALNDINLRVSLARYIWIIWRNSVYAL